MNSTYHVIGLMSGSSLDGLDIVYAEIQSGVTFTFQIIAAETFEYPAGIKQFLTSINRQQKDFSIEGKHFANITADAVNKFMYKNHITAIDFIASHGHTILHEPSKGITVQIDDGKTLAERTGFTVIDNFRQKDIDAGGQGAPLVPICDELFFNNYHACLNIGGIANISYNQNGDRFGFDICGANQLLNACSSQLGVPFDENGAIAKSGSVDIDLLNRLNNHPYFKLPFPKSLDNSAVQKEFTDTIISSGLKVADQLATATMHIAIQISEIIKGLINSLRIPPSQFQLLVTGGGAYNNYLIQLIEQYCGITIQLPSKEIIEFKEALAMCLMGVLRRENRPNFLTTVTGAAKAVSGGDIHLHS